MTVYEILTDKVTWALGGGLIALAGSYFSFSRDILKELHFLKGQNSLLLHRFQLLDKMHERVTSLDKDQDRVRYDLNNCWTAIRNLRGGQNGTSTSRHEPE